MANTVNLSFNIQGNVEETIDVTAEHAGNPQVSHSLSTGSGAVTVASNLHASTTPPATIVWSDQITLSAGAATIDLTNLTYPNERTAQDMTGDTVCAFFVAAAAANTAAVKIEGGATNPYELFGDAATEIDVDAGQVWGFVETSAANLVAVSGTVKEIDLSSSDTDAIVSVVIVAGS